MSRIINWLGVAAGATSLLLLVVSLFMPWWQLTIGDNLITVNASPINMNFGLFGSQFTIPLLWALNIGIILTFAAAGIILLIYSVVPTKSYAKDLLGFSYKKPIYAFVFFLAGLVALVAVAGVLNVNVPLMGVADVSLPTSITMGATISAAVSATFLLPFWLSVITVALCIATRLYHPRITKKYEQQTQPLPPPPPPPSNATAI
jgi:hypothetical protein